MTKKFLLFLLTIIIVFNFSQFAYAATDTLNNGATQVKASEINDEAYYNAYNDIISEITHVPDFRYEAGILTASEPFVIDAFKHKFKAAYNPNTGLYEVDLMRNYGLFGDEPLNQNSETIFYFNWNGTQFAFSIFSDETDYGYIDSNLAKDIPDEFDYLMKQFDTSLVLGFFNEDSDIMGKTNIQPNLVTSKGIEKYFIYVRINRSYSIKQYNMADTIIHELGHGIIDDIACHYSNDFNTVCFILNNNLIIADLINKITPDGNYGAIYDSISDYAATKISEIPSEAFAQVYLAPETATDFNIDFYNHMLELWTSVKGNSTSLQ